MKKLGMLLCICLTVCLFFGCGGKSSTGKKAGEKGGVGPRRETQGGEDDSA